MGKIMAVVNQKGGVGKTTTTVNLISSLGEKKKKTLLVDIDPQANATSGLGVDKRALEKTTYDLLIGSAKTEEVLLHTAFKGVDLLPSGIALAGAEVELVELPRREGRLKAALAALRDAYDYILIDCPPSLGLLTLNGLCAADTVLVPIQCEYYALEGLSQLMTTVRQVKRLYNEPLELEGVVMTMYDKRLNLTRQVAEEVEQHFPRKVFSTVIPRTVRLSEAPSYGKPVNYYDHSSKGARAYRKLAEEILKKNKEGTRMASPKGGLGKGLGALFMENAADDGGVVTLRLSEIEPNRDQPRKQFDEDALAELSASIAQHGILQPLLVRPLAIGGYQLVAGERRWRAARMAGLLEAPVVIREMSEQEAAELAMIENLQREDLNPIEEARGYQSLMEGYGLTQEETARVVNKSRPAVANALRLLRLPDTVADMVLAGRLSAGHARALLAFPTPEEQETMALKAEEQSLSVRELEKRAKQAHSPRKVSRETTESRFAADSFYSEVELALKECLGRGVKVQKNAKGAGSLQLEFYSQEDLQELANRLYNR